MFKTGSEGQLVSPIPVWLKYVLLGFFAVAPVALYVASQFVTINEIAGAAILVAVTIAAVVNFEFGLMLLVVFLPFEPLLLKYIPAEFVLFFRLIPEAVIGALLIRGFVEARTRAEIIDPIRYSLFLLLGLSLISALLNRVEPVTAVIGLRQIFRFILLYQAAVLYGLNRRKVLITLSVVGAIAVFESVLGIIQALIGARLDSFLSAGGEIYLGQFRVSQGIEQVREEGRRVFATMGRYDQLGTFLSLVAASTLGFIYNGSEKVKRAALLLLFIILPGLFLSYSRASWFGFVLALIVVGVIIKRDKKVLAALMILVVGIAGYTFYKEVEVKRLLDEPEITPIQRLLEAFSERRLRAEYRDKGRVYYYIETPKALFPSYLLLGVGPGQFGGGAAALLHNTQAYDELNLPFGIYTTEGHVDSNWLSLLGELGILGLAAFASVFILLIIFSRRILKDEKSGWLERSLALGLIGATFCFMFMGFLATNFEVRTLAPYYWLLAALTVITYYNRESITDQ